MSEEGKDTHIPFTLNEYGYCLGNPMILVDLNGKAPDLSDVSESIGESVINEIKEIVYDVSGIEITNEEIELILIDPRQAYLVYTCGKKAEEWTNKIFQGYYQDIGDGFLPHWQDGDSANAYRHAMWNALLTKYMGSRDAKAWNDAHEAWTDEVLQKEHGGGYTRKEHTNMDFQNNAIGRSCVKWYEFYISEKTISNRVIEKLRKGKWSIL